MSKCGGRVDGNGEDEEEVWFPPKKGGARVTEAVGVETGVF